MHQQSGQPPAMALRFLRWFCPPALCESIEGDLLEQFEIDHAAVGHRIARRRFTWQVLRFFRPGILLRNKFSYPLTPASMIQNYGKVMLRVLWKQKTHAAIHILGLTMGLAFALMTGIFVDQELRVNNSLRDVDRLYMAETATTDGAFWHPFLSPAPLAAAATEQYPSLFEGYYRYWDKMITVSREDQHFRIQSLIGDSTLVSFLGLPILHGDAVKPFRDTRSMVVTRTTALRFFNRTNVIGEVLTLSGESGDSKRYDYTITAVLDDLPRNSITDLLDMNAQIFLCLQKNDVYNLNDPAKWESGVMVSYLKLRAGAMRADAEQAIAKIMQTQTPEGLRKLIVSLTPLRTYYLEANDGRVRKLVYTVSAIAAFILVLAVINFINITIGSALGRLREIGVRKAIGSRRGQLITQFLSESLALSIGAFLLALGVYMLARPYASDVLGIALPALGDLSSKFTGVMLLLTLTVGLLAGAYPAFLLSSYNAVESLRNKASSLKAGGGLSRSLVALQFILAMGVFAFSIVITRQVAFFLQKDLGYNKDYVLTISSVPRRWSEEGVRSMEAARLEFLALPMVKNVSLSWEIPAGNYGNQLQFYRQGVEEDKALDMPMLMTDEHFADTYGIPIKEGVFLADEQHAWHLGDLVVNESAGKALGIGVGDKVRIKGDTVVFTVAGIIKDFHFFSLHENVKPMAFLHTRGTKAFRHFSIKLEAGDMAGAVAAVETKWRRVFPDDPFVYAFMDQELAKLYKNEIRLKKASNLATGLMLVIVFTGVFGMVSLAVSKRTKEMGIRKVLGASVDSIILLMSKPYLILIGLSCAVATPLAYYFSIQWLQAFVYRVPPAWWCFVLPVVAILGLTLLLIAARSLRTALANPTRALRYE
ncbi:FtsX-like permease family protein [Fulvivirgaceae bacterium PWU5]|uniref:FtsX-like permease family protein n=1 Tax=Dawidia cretensis TaxID=2782350 RepID=A0AAP2GUH7_9BACT|nr:FtsX-like permease family protein [Dawidia cretensis]MBT1707562.1 FtsX-like permease family protein [Dawidia cretensis]